MLKKKNINSFFKFVILFFSCMIILSLIELFGGLIIELAFHFSFWDYSNYKFNIGKYICLEMALLWGLASILFVLVLRPVMDLIIKKIPDFFVYMSLFLFVSDMILTLILKK